MIKSLFFILLGILALVIWIFSVWIMFQGMILIGLIGWLISYLISELVIKFMDYQDKKRLEKWN
ncbi:hypothetical protein M9B41_06130 [SAR86 cluster bacterium]|nr:hypothetical protein M9B41_06130 [SAR86 cluster bacterium]